MAISGKAVEEVITCVQVVVRGDSFIQRNFFSDSGMAMLQHAVAAGDRVIVTEEYNPWSVFGDGSNQQIVSDFQSWQEKTLFRRKAS